MTWASSHKLEGDILRFVDGLLTEVLSPERLSSITTQIISHEVPATKRVLYCRALKFYQTHESCTA